MSTTQFNIIKKATLNLEKNFVKHYNSSDQLIKKLTTLCHSNRAGPLGITLGEKQNWARKSIEILNVFKGEFFRINRSLLIN
jgi:hypothetical protein